ncbi:MAG TPA: lysoplasmalogenase [Panacibacter sp.]|nr:lysoplasmalogenase [Panacibacter sp.]HNP45747.1 lysoplasmalogenase [Panacibacter sp.]
MKLSRLIIPLLFCLALLADCLMILNAQNEYRVFTKTLLVPILLAGIYIEAKDTKHTRSKMIANLGLFFCFLGDFFLLFDQDPYYFVFGLGSFLVAHIFFIVFFYRLKPFSDKYRLFIFTTAIIILFYLMALLFLIWSNVTVQGLQIPVAIYAAVLGIMLLTAANTLNNRSMKRLSKNYFIPGAVLFVLSDSALAINKFSFKFNYSGVIVMVLYAAALLVLTTGMLRFLRK